ncbi:MAG: hypothetical protein AABY22_29640 [Nanoarchaeota archaeon]
MGKIIKCEKCNKEFERTSGFQRFCGSMKKRQGCSFGHYREYITSPLALKKRREYYKRTMEKWKERGRKRNLTPTGIFYIIKRGARNRQIEFNLNVREFVSWYITQNQICFYCRRTLEQVGDNDYNYRFPSKRFSIDRKDNNKGYSINNIVLACNRCNTIKSNYFSVEEMLKIGLIIYEKEYVAGCTKTR